MCVGQPLNTFTEIKVSFLSPDRKATRGPRGGEVIVGHQTVLTLKAWRGPLLPTPVSGFIIINSLAPLLEWERFWAEPFVLSPLTCSQVGSSLTQERWDLRGCEQRVVFSQEKWVQSLKCLRCYIVPLLGIYSCSMRTKQHWPLLVSSPWQEVSAAPAICNGRVHGILSWAKGSITLGREGFFTKVHPYARWIMKTIQTYWGSSVPLLSVRHLHDFYTGSTALSIVLALEQNPNKTHPIKRKKWH